MKPLSHKQTTHRAECLHMEEMSTMAFSEQFLRPVITWDKANTTPLQLQSDRLSGFSKFKHA